MAISTINLFDTLGVDVIPKATVDGESIAFTWTRAAGHNLDALSIANGDQLNIMIELPFGIHTASVFNAQLKLVNPSGSLGWSQHGFMPDPVTGPGTTVTIPTPPISTTGLWLWWNNPLTTLPVTGTPTIAAMVYENNNNAEPTQLDEFSVFLTLSPGSENITNYNTWVDQIGGSAPGNPSNPPPPPPTEYFDIIKTINPPLLYAPTSSPFDENIVFYSTPIDVPAGQSARLRFPVPVGVDRFIVDQLSMSSIVVRVDHSFTKFNSPIKYPLVQANQDYIPAFVYENSARYPTVLQTSATTMPLSGYFVIKNTTGSTVTINSFRMTMRVIEPTSYTEWLDAGGPTAEDPTPVTVPEGGNSLAVVELHDSDNTYAVGQVLVFGGDKEVTSNTRIADSKVAGVVTTAGENTPMILNFTILDSLGTTFDENGTTVNTGSEFPIALAQSGRTRCKVTGPVKKGDTLVTDGKGGARSADDPNEPGPKVTGGALVGKAMEDSDKAVNLINIHI